MRIKPSVPLVVAVFVVYTAIWIGVASVTAAEGFEFAEAFDSVAFSRNLVWGLAAGAVVGVVVTTALGWWRPVLGGDEPAVVGWARRLPLLLTLLILATTDYRAFADIDTELLLWIVAASVLVGFAEELVFRGVVVVGLRRGARREFTVWWLSTLLFALIHVPNVFLGAELPGAIAQTCLAFAGGTLFYVVRRSSRSILPAMALHGLWDFTLFAAAADALVAVRLGLELVLFVAIVVGRRRLFGPAPEPATAG